MPQAFSPFAPNEAFAAPPVAQGDERQPRYVPGEILVRFADDASDAEMNSAHARHGSWGVRKFRQFRNLQQVKLGPGVNVKEAIERYRRHARVLYAEPNWIVRAVETVPGDTMFNQLWGLRNTGQTGGLTDADIDASNAWDVTMGSRSVVVAVIDTGVDYTHSDLAANIYQGDCTVAGVDNDANGYIDDCHGWNVIGNINNPNAPVPNGDPMDDHGHGTHVSGTIGAIGNNSAGVAGVNWQVTILACKFLDSTGYGTTAGAIACLDYVAHQKDKGVNIVATNNSWGGDLFSQALMDAIDAHRTRGILFIAAAGNNGADNDVGPFYPASYHLPNVISVAATTATDDMAWFSNQGARTVHLGAPGDSILSTTPNNTYGLMSGTSMATPHVTGVAALVKAGYPAATWVELKNRILTGGDRDPLLAGRTATGKRLNANGALNCSNSVVLARAEPVSNVVVGAVGGPISLEALNINCGALNGNVTVTVHRDTAPAAALAPLTLQNVDGTGLYTAQWSPPDTGSYTLTFPNSDALTFPSGDAVRVDVPYATYNYAETTYNYRNIAGTNLNLGDDASAPVTPGFPVKFGDQSYTTVYVGSNGILSFTADITNWINTSLPVSGLVTLIAPFWDDLSPDPTHNVFWAVAGQPGSRELIIEWRNVWRYNCSAYPEASLRFQVVFFENKNDVLFNYADAAIGANCESLMFEALEYGSSATVGVQTGPAGANTFSFDLPRLRNNMALLWTAVGAAVPPPPALNVTPASLSFGNVAVGATANLTFTVANSGGGTLTGSVSTAASGFCVVVSGSCAGSGASFSLAAGASQAVTVRFSPTSSATYSGNVSVTSNGGSASPAVTGTGTVVNPVMSVTPASLNFGNVAVGATSNLTFTVTNSGGGTLSGSASTTASGFCVVVSGSCSAGGASFSLAAGASQSVTVRFSPASSTTYFGNVTFTSNGSSASRGLTGTGTTPRTIQVTSPNGGEIWARNTSKLITWSGTGLNSNVQIRVSRDGGSNWSMIFSSTPSSATGGSRTWTVTGSATTRARIRVCTIGISPNVCDNSDANFTIQ